MPGTCSGCGEPVEARIGETRPFRHDIHGATLIEHKLPTAWCDPGSDRPHECDPAKRNAYLKVIR